MEFFKIRASKFFAALGFTTLMVSIITPGDIWKIIALLGFTFLLESFCWAWQVSDEEFAEYEQYLLNKRSNNDDIGPYGLA